MFCYALSVGLLDALRLNAAIAELDAQFANEPNVVLATDTAYNAGIYYPANLRDYSWPVSEIEAMSVPAVARAINIIASTVGHLPLERYSAMTGQHMASTPLFYQPDPNSPRPLTYGSLAKSMILYGVGYTQVLEVYADDGRPSRMRWVSPTRVTRQLNFDNTLVTGYLLDGTSVPQSGVGSLIAFPYIDNEGLLLRSARTIRTAIELEEAAQRAAAEPAPQMVLKNNGVDLPTEKVTALLEAWKVARRTRNTAYAGNLEVQQFGFSAKDSALVESRQFMASEIARAVGIPAWYLNAETASMTYSNTEQERRTLIDFSLAPVLDCIAKRLQMPDVQPRAVEVRFDIDEFLRGDSMQRLEYVERLLDRGLIRRETAIRELDLEDEGPAEQ